MMAKAQHVQVNGKRLWDSIQALGLIGADPSGGVTRLSLSNEELIARQFIISEMKAAGLEVRQDEAGNLIGRLEGEEQRAGAVVTGSHIDTVIQAGQFDGALGVLGGIEVLRTIKEQSIRHDRPFEVICFTDEEGVRFGAGYLGSRAMANTWDEKWLDLTDSSGMSLREAMEHSGLNPDYAALASRSSESIHAYVELHIEQGRVLEELNKAVGIATAIYGHRWFEVTIHGRADHAGTTPMKLRQDPMPAAAEVVLAVEQIAVKHGGVVTTGTFKLAPAAINVIPGEAVFTLDVRHESLESLNKLEVAIKGELSRLTAARGLTYAIRTLDAAVPVQTSEYIAKVITDSCEDAGLPAEYMICGAGHDAVVMSELAEMGLILVRSKDGISHHPLEWSSREDCEAGVNVLLQTLIQLGNDVN
ncbi:Zn-dependent hydrolase [Paenibacillus sp. FSL K6-3182]|uniref:Zn-dependent hydrolase n=1 Tax=Paenibacillus sp. FSL K6-3182 TaxID=2921495 RepID=UPI0030CFFD3E